MRNLFIVLPLLVLPLTTQAASTVNVNVTGRLIAGMTCDVTAPTTIAFGDIVTTKIGGATSTEYKKDLDVRVACTSPNPQQKSQIRVTANGASTNKLPVSGTAQGFHLALKKGTTALNFGTYFDAVDGAVDLSLTPERNADPFVIGNFTAAITVEVNVI